MDTQLQNLLADVFGVRAEEITLDTRKEDVGSWDSLKQMDLVVSLERAYEISLSIEDIIAMQSVRDIIARLKAKGVAIEN